MERDVTDKQMKLEAHQRNTIEKGKKKQLTDAQDEIFKDIDEVTKRDQKLSDLSKASTKKTMTQEEIRAQGARIMAEVDNESKPRDSKLDLQEDIFGDDDVQETQETHTYQGESGTVTFEEIVDEDDEPQIEEVKETPPSPPKEEVALPEVRQTGDSKQNIGFTEKRLGHFGSYLPARESAMKEAPYPKSKHMPEKKRDPNEAYMDIEDRNPIWLKDRGDHYYKQGNYTAAIQGYSKCLEQDKEFLMAKLNKATVFMKIRQYVASISEICDLFRSIEAVDKKEREGDEVFFNKIQARAYIKRGACQAWISQFDDAITDIEKAMAFKDVWSEGQISKMKLDI